MAQEDQNMEYFVEAPPPPPPPPPHSLVQVMVCGLWLMDFVTPNLYMENMYLKMCFTESVCGCGVAHKDHSYSSHCRHTVLRELFHRCMRSICVLLQNFDSHSLGLRPHFCFKQLGLGVLAFPNSWGQKKQKKTGWYA